ncbi:SGNH/GDSL hydrolase family protein [Bacillus sp. C1]
MKIALFGDSLTEGRPGISFYKILRDQFPNDTLYNLGKPGETVTGLYNRIKRAKDDETFDMSFLWIGVNDIYAKILGVKAQPVVSNHEEFTEQYQKVLEKLLTRSKKVIAVSPTIIGEIVDNEWNKKTYELGTIICSLSQQYQNVYYLDLHKEFTKTLAKKNSSEYITTKPMKIVFEALFLRKEKRIDYISEKRGLQLTLDGVHLNSNGATIVANQYAHIIQKLRDKEN